MKIRVALVVFLALFPSLAMGQNTTGLVVATCGNQTYTTGNPGPFTVDTTGKICANSSGAPSGAAGGDLSGTYPNPTVAKVAGVTPGTGVATALGVNIGSAGAFVTFNGALGTPSSGVLTNATGLPLSTGITGFGTGIATALAVNTGSAGATVLFNGAGGTPSSLVGTNITGTAAGLTAGNVTTNANLTGPVTSVGNATTIASVVTAGGPTGSSTVVPVITYNAAGQLTTVTTATIASAVSSITVNATYDLTTASGNQTVSGFGFTPSACDVFGAVNGGAINVYTTYAGHSDSAKTQSVLYSNGTATVGYTTGVFVVAFDTTGTNNQVGTLTAYNSGSITIAWVKGGIPTGTFGFSVRCFK